VLCFFLCGGWEGGGGGKNVWDLGILWGKHKLKLRKKEMPKGILTCKRKKIT